MSQATVTALIAEGEAACRAKLHAAVRDHLVTHEQSMWYAACWHAYSSLTSRAEAVAVWREAVAEHAEESRGER